MVNTTSVNQVYVFNLLCSSFGKPDSLNHAISSILLGGRTQSMVSEHVLEIVIEIITRDGQMSPQGNIGIISDCYQILNI